MQDNKYMHIVGIQQLIAQITHQLPAAAAHLHRKVLQYLEAL